MGGDLLTSLISCHISFAVIVWKFPDIKKQGHSDTWTTSVSLAAMAKVSGGCPFAVLNSCKYGLLENISTKEEAKIKSGRKVKLHKITCDVEVLHAHRLAS